MRTIHTLKSFTWKPEPPAPGKRLPPELRERSFKPNRVETVADEVADFAVSNGFARDPGDPKGQRAAQMKREQQNAAKAREKSNADSKAKADADAAKKAADDAAAKAKAEADAKAQQQEGQAGGKPNPSPDRLKFELVKVDAKTSHVAVVTMVEGKPALVNLTAQPLPKAVAESLLADLGELEPKTLEEAKEIASSEEG